MLKRGRAALAALALAAVVASLTILPAAATHAIGVSFAGPVTAGEELVLSCPEGYTLGAEPASFYRDPRGRVPLPGYESVQPTRYVDSPEGDRTVSAVWVVPQGARYAKAHANCFPTTSISLTAECVFDEGLGQWVYRLNYRITNASSIDQHGTVYYRVDEGDRQGGWTTTVLANATVSGSFQIIPDNTAEHFVFVEYELTTGQVFDSNRVVLLVGCSDQPPPTSTTATTVAPTTTTTAPTTTTVDSGTTTTMTTIGPTTSMVVPTTTT